jgi:hypothetical protein
MAANLDIETTIERIRADQKATFDRAVALAETEEDRQYVRMQASLSGVAVEFARWDMERHNLSGDAGMAAVALGDSLSGIVWSFTANSGLSPSDAVGIVMGRMMELLMMRIDGEEPANAIECTTSATSQPFGRG